MTREEAISEWTFRSNHIKKWLDEYGEEPSIRHYVELIDMAIEALQADDVQGGDAEMQTIAKTPDYMQQSRHDDGKDLISRADALKAIDYRRKTANIDGQIILDEVEDRIRELPSADRPSGEWKPVSDGTPQSVGIYIVTCKDEYGSVYVDYDFWTVLDEFKYNCSKVIAWIPFPKPYCGTKMKGEK